MHITDIKYITIVGKAVELAGIIPEINKLNIVIESRIVISIVSDKEKENEISIDYALFLLLPYVMLIFHYYLVAKEIQVLS